MLDVPSDQPVVIDEFTSVVDRQVAKIGAHAVQKWARKHDRQFVAASCHYDIIDWLQPDWVLDVAERVFTWRSVQPRPRIAVDIRKVDYEVWRLFAPFHYLTATLNRTARCFVAFIDGQPTSFAGVLRRPHPKAKDIMGVSRLVTLPDWQGLGLAFVLVEAIGGAYRVAGQRLRTYPAHPVLVHGFDRSPRWDMKQAPGMGRGVFKGPNTTMSEWRHGSRPCAVFEYVGKPWPDRAEALAFLREAHAGGVVMTDVWEKVAHG
jgi:GNAT superfamily N-acetyltransferase